MYASDVRIYVFADKYTAVFLTDKQRNSRGITYNAQKTQISRLIRLISKVFYKIQLNSRLVQNLQLIYIALTLD